MSVDGRFFTHERVKTSRDFAQTRPEQLQVLDRNGINVEGATIVRCWRVIGQYLQINARWSHFWMQLKGRNHQFMHRHAPKQMTAGPTIWTNSTCSYRATKWIHEVDRQFISHYSKVGSIFGMIEFMRQADNSQAIVRRSVQALASLKMYSKFCHSAVSIIKIFKNN